MAASATIALANDRSVKKVLGRRSAATISTINRPVPCAASSSRLSGAGVPAIPGTLVPSASATSAIVDAVPIVLQCPRLRIIADSDWANSASDRVPARTSSDSRHTSVPQPSGLPRNVPVSIGPPGTTTAGRSTDAAAISSAGMVLSQPPSSTTPSTGLARSISSAAIAARLRHSIAVGFTSVSPSDALRAARAAAARPGDRVLVLGPGTIGLLTAMFLRAAGVQVHLLGSTEPSLAFARSLGFEHTWLAAPAAAFDAVIDASNAPYLPARALDLVEPSGRVVYIGLAGTPSTIDTRALVLKDVTAVGILSASPAIDPTIAAYASGQVDPRPLVAATVTLDQVGAVLAGDRPHGAAPGPKFHIDPRPVRG
jgi:hypothetical protein